MFFTLIYFKNKGHCTPITKFSSEIFACKKINMTSHCVSCVYTLPPKLSSVIKNQIRFDFLHFCILSKHFDRKG